MRQRSSRRRPAARAAFTLLEVLLASAIGLLILYGVYLAINIQLRYAESGRAQVEQATLARSLVARISGDITPSVGQPDPSRYRPGGQAGGQSGGSGAAPSGSPSTSPSSSTT